MSSVSQSTADAVEKLKQTQGTSSNVFQGVHDFYEKQIKGKGKDGGGFEAELTKMVQNANDFITKGPNYASIKNQDDLRIKYQTAQMNTIANADQLQSAARNYYTVTEGGQKANDMQKKQLETAADKIIGSYAREFADTANQATILNQTLSANINNYIYAQTYYDNLVDENKKLLVEVGRLENDSTTNNRKSYYEDQEIASLEWWYWWILAVYVILVISFGAAIFMSPSEYSLKYKFLILALLVAYIFVAKYIMIWFIGTVLYVYNSILPTNVYLGFLH